MKYYFILTIIFSVIYYLYLNPAFIHPNFTGRFIIKKLLFSIVLGIYLPFCDPLNEESFLNVISLLFVFIYTSYKLSLDCPNGYAESSLPFLKAFFRLAVFFICISFDKEELWLSIISIGILLCISLFVNKFGKQVFIQDKSEYIELVLLCIENALSLIIAALLTVKPFGRVLLVAINEEIIFVIVHLFMMYIVKIILKEDVSQYFFQKRIEMLI